jgi:hypothetical protein
MDLPDYSFSHSAPRRRLVEAIYMDGKRSAEVGDVVTAGGRERSVVVDVAGSFVTIVAIGLSKETGQPVIISPADDCPASKCSYFGKAKSSLLAEALAKSGIKR